jgi:hypothetical protein
MAHLISELMPPDRPLRRDPVDQPADRRGVADDVVAEDTRLPAVRQQERRKDADQGRLAGAVLPQHGDALARADRERDVGQRGHRATTPAATAVEALLKI